ncbi:MAG: hypothetical protein RIQ81_75 [Pseudomonadota bacterium]|jgi:hypothetical protein
MKTQVKRSAAVAAIAIATAVAATNCGKKDSSDDSGDTSTEALTLSYPLGLSLSVAPQTNSSTALALLDEKEPSVKVKNEEAGKMIRGEADSCFPPALGKADGAPLDEKCYEFDSEMIYIKSGSTFVNGTKDGTSVTATGEACMVTYTRSQVKRITSMVDRTLGMVQMMLCQAKKAGQGAPTSDGGSVDFKAIMTAAITAAGKNPDHLPFNSAKITKVGDNFVTEAEMKMPAAPGTAPGANDPTEKITLTHKPTNADNTEFEGSVVIRRSKEFGGGDKERILTINYVRSAGRVKYRLLTAAMNKAISGSAVDADGKLDLNVSTNAAGAYLDPATGNPYAQQNDAVSGILAVSFNMNPDNDTGNFSYWQNPGAGYDEQTRGFVFKMDADSSGNLYGCSSSGANSGGSIRKAMKTGSAIAPDRSYHPFACGNGAGSAQSPCTDTENSPGSDGDGSFYSPSRNGQTIKMYVPAVADANTTGRQWAYRQHTNNVAVQCFKQNSTGVYEIDGSAMTNEGTAGFELVASSASTLPPPPDLTGVK